MTERALKLCLRAYPRRVRHVDGDLLLGLSLDFVESGASPTRQAASLVRGGFELRLGLTGAPWAAALARLALPLAGLLLAAMVIGAFDPFSHAGRSWWIWAAGTGGAALALLGIASGRVAPAAAGGLAVVAVCALDVRGGLAGHLALLPSARGYHWGALFVDVLPALLPASALLVAAACATRRERAPAAPARAAAWTLAGTSALVCVALTIRENTTPGTTLLAAAVALGATVVMAGLRSRATASDRLAAALALGALWPPVQWSLLAGAPWHPTAATGVAAQLLGAVVLALTVLSMMRRAAVPALRST